MNTLHRIMAAPEILLMCIPEDALVSQVEIYNLHRIIRQGQYEVWVERYHMELLRHFSLEQMDKISRICSRLGLGYSIIPHLTWADWLERVLICALERLDYDTICYGLYQSSRSHLEDAEVFKTRPVMKGERFFK